MFLSTCAAFSEMSSFLPSNFLSIDPCVVLYLLWIRTLFSYVNNFVCYFLMLHLVFKSLFLVTICSSLLFALVVCTLLFLSVFLRFCFPALWLTENSLQIAVLVSAFAIMATHLLHVLTAYSLCVSSAILPYFCLLSLLLGFSCFL